ncbi:MAG: UbiD family decarboxylase [Halobacteriales archaeon]
MGPRNFLSAVDEQALSEPVDPRFELPALATRDVSRPVVFESVAGYPGVRAVANLASSRELVATALDTDPAGIVGTVSAAMDDPLAVTETAPPAFEHVADDPDLDDHLPIPVYYNEHERQYFTASIVVARDPDTGVQNLSFHRLMYDGGNRLVMRLVERHLHDIFERTDGPLQVAVLLGVHPAVELAAATSFAPDASELELANRFLDGDLATTETHGLELPSHAEVVMFGDVTEKTAEEGPFVDLSRTWDRTRQQPVLEIGELWTRPEPLVRVLVPGQTEHAHLMGIPQEPRIYRVVENTVPTVQDVVLTPGGASWLHGVVQLDKRTEGDPKNAGMAALAAHPSMKKVTVVDDDVDPADPVEVEWATATRMQPHEDVTVVENADGSSLDPSQDYDRGTTSKWIVDATVPDGGDRSGFEAATVPGAEDVSLDEYR